MPHGLSTWTTLAASLLAHGALAALAVGHGFPAPRFRPVNDVPVDLIVEPAIDGAEDAPPSSEAVPSMAQRGPPASHHHRYPVPFDHDATPHDPKLVHVPLLAAPMPRTESAESALAPTPTAAPTQNVALAATAAPPLFVLGPSTAFVSRGTTSAPGAASLSTDATDVLNERDVDVRARVLARAPVTYPLEARRAEVEADVPVEIMVDEGGNVLSARAPERTGYHLDSAAVDAIRNYRFSPARHKGRPVRVRMRWVVQFRLD